MYISLSFDGIELKRRYYIIAHGLLALVFKFTHIIDILKLLNKFKNIKKKFLFLRRGFTGRIFLIGFFSYKKQK